MVLNKHINAHIVCTYKFVHIMCLSIFMCTIICSHIFREHDRKPAIYKHESDKRSNMNTYDPYTSISKLERSRTGMSG